MDGLLAQQKYIAAVMARPPAPYPLPLAAWLDTLDRSSLAFIANRTLGEPPHHAWPSRERATAALLHWDANRDEAASQPLRREDRVAHDRIVRWMVADQMRADEEYLRAAQGGALPVVSASTVLDIADDDPEAWAQL